MKSKKSIRTLAILALATGLIGCAPDPKPFDPISMQHMYRDRAMENSTPELGAMPLNIDRRFLVKLDGNTNDPTTRPTPLPTTAQSFGPAVRMSLRDLIQLAAINSLQVRVANYQPAIEEARVTEAGARFDPSFFTNVNFATQTVVSPSPQSLAVGSSFQTSTLA